MSQRVGREFKSVCIEAEPLLMEYAFLFFILSYKKIPGLIPDLRSFCVEIACISAYLHRFSPPTSTSMGSSLVILNNI